MQISQHGLDFIAATVLRGRATPLEHLPPAIVETAHHMVKRGPLATEMDCGHDTPCWIWAGNAHRRGEGGSRSDGTRDLAYRAVYREMIAPIPEGMTLDHLCFVIGCVNPDHLEVVTLAENTRRQYAAGRGPERYYEARRAQTHCKRGHEFTPENTLISCGRRRCRACGRERMRSMRQDAREAHAS